MNLMDFVRIATHVGLHHFLLFSALLFAIGLFGLLTKKGLIHYMPVSDYSGQLMAIFAVAVAASEVAVGVALAFRIYRDHGTVDVDELREMKG